MNDHAEIARLQALARSQDVGLMRACEQIDALSAEIDGLPLRHEYEPADPDIGWMEGKSGDWCRCGRLKDSKVHRTARVILAALSVEPTGTEWRCTRCGSTRWVAASLTGPVSLGGKAIRQCIRCRHYGSDPVEAAGTEGGGGHE